VFGVVRTEAIAVDSTQIRALRWTSDALYTGIKETYALGRVVRGHSEWQRGTRAFPCGPGALLVKQPGDVVRELAHDGPIAMDVVAFSLSVVEAAVGRIHIRAQLEPGDPRGVRLHGLLDAIDAGACGIALDVAIAEAIEALADLHDVTVAPRRPVARAIELLRARLADPIALDELAAHAGIDKFQLCRAFRDQLDMTPYAYLTQLRIARAKQLLATGVRASDIAPLVGLYDQSQLNRHFRRIVGTTPGRYAAVVTTEGQ